MSFWVVAGGGGFLGGHVVRELVRRGERVRAVDIKPLVTWYQRLDDAENVTADLSRLDVARYSLRGATHVVNLAADMGGMGFIATNKARCMMTVLTSTHVLMAAEERRVQRYFYASSACVYPDYRQDEADVSPLREADAYPAMPEDGYGWEKLFSERMCQHYAEELNMPVAIGRYHNVYGPHGTYDGGREKAPAAICRKVARAVLDSTNEIEIWGDGEQTRSFTYVDDAVRLTLDLMLLSRFEQPVNIGSSELVTINQLVDLVEEIAGVKLERRYDLTKPQGVRGRNSDNTLIREVLGSEPSTSLAEGLEVTYRWVYDQLKRA